MNLVLFTPATNKSAIGRMAALVVKELTRCGIRVTVIRTESVSQLETPHHSFGVEILRWNQLDTVRSVLQNADSIVYQIGDNYQFHQGCLEWLPDYPGVVCLHDYFLGHLFWAWAENRRTKANAVLRAWYAETTANSYFSADSTNFIAGSLDVAPMTEWIASMATAVVTHSSWGIDRVLNSCSGPVHVIALAYDIPKTPSSSTTKSDKDKLVTILTIGHVNPNKRAESVIRAIGNSPVLREKARYRLVGMIEPAMKEKLVNLASDLNVQLLVSGGVTDLELQSAIHEADIMCCLRLPALEAASASAIESMLYGKPTVVMDTGFYSELPDEFVKKISPEREQSELQSVLEMLCTDEEKRLALGHNAAEWASAHFNAHKYAAGLIAICESAARAKPILEMSKFYSAILWGWGQKNEKASSGEVIQSILPMACFEEIRLE